MSQKLSKCFRFASGSGSRKSIYPSHQRQRRQRPQRGHARWQHRPEFANVNASSTIGSPRPNERALTTPLRQQYEALLRRRVAPDVAAREVRSFELAIRARLWRLVLLRDDRDAA